MCRSTRPTHRSIPAWAGEPVKTLAAMSLAKVYPRVGGEPPWGASNMGMTRVYPRVGGGTPLPPNFQDIFDGLSPRGRGNPMDAWIDEATLGSIPAWAGEPTLQDSYRSYQPVYPRVGGGTGCHVGFRDSSMGLSPRGRGNQSKAAEALRKVGSIPAWAGEPRSISPTL